MSGALYVGAAGKAARYLGARPDTNLYLGARSLWPSVAPVEYVKFSDALVIEGVLSNDSRTYSSGPGYGRQQVRAETPLYGKVYLEYTLNKYLGGNFSFGLCNASYFGVFAESRDNVALFEKRENHVQRIVIGEMPYVIYEDTDVTQGDVIRLAYDSDVNEISFAVNGGTWLGPFKTAEFRQARAGSPLTPYVDFYESYELGTVTINTGQSPFTFTPPSGFGPADPLAQPPPGTDFRFQNADRQNDIAIQNDGRRIYCGWGYPESLHGAHSVSRVPDKAYVEFTIDTYVGGMGVGISAEDTGGHGITAAILPIRPHMTVGSNQLWAMYLTNGQPLVLAETASAGILGTGSVIGMKFDIGRSFYEGIVAQGTVSVRHNNGDWIDFPILFGLNSVCPYGLIPIDGGAMSLNAGHAPFVYTPPSGYFGPET